MYFIHASWSTDVVLQEDGEPDVAQSFDDMNLDDNLLRGIYAYGFEKPSAIQQRAIIPIIKGKWGT